MARVDDNLPGLGKKGLAPRLRNGAGAQTPAPKLSSAEGYVLSRIDGRTTLWEVCLLVPLPRPDTLRALRQLRAKGIIEVPGSAEPLPPIEMEPPPPPPPPPPAQASQVLPQIAAELVPTSRHSQPGAGNGTGTAPAPADTLPAGTPVPHLDDSGESGAAAIVTVLKHGAPPQPVPPLSAPTGLTAEERARIEALHEQIRGHRMDAFTLLGLAQEADLKPQDVQRAYFRLSKEFHPDRYFKRDLGAYRQHLIAIFQALTEARDVLIDPERRAAYLAGSYNTESRSSKSR